MARPAVDLPDPLNDNAPGALNSADDLLAQLAGEEIDRLLSEADDALPTPQPQTPDRPATRPTPTAAPTNRLDDAVLDATESALDDLLNDPDPTPLSAAAEAPQAPAQTTQKTPKSKTSAADPIAAAILADPAPVAPSATPAPLSAADALAAELEADEAAHSAALKRMKSPAAAPVPTPTPADDPDGSTIIDVDESEIVSERIPLIVRILEWINAPLAFLPLGAREALGKIALVTTLNALAILAYVLIFRRPH